MTLNSTPLPDGQPANLSVPPKPENLWLNLGLNVALPFIIMGKLSAENLLGPKLGLILALVFPLGYGIYDFLARRKTNAISIFGFCSILLSGAFGLLKLEGFWFAVKDAVVSSFIGIFLLLSSGRQSSFLREIFFSETVMDVARINAALAERNTTAAFASLLRRCSVLIACAFFVSGILGFFLTRYLLKSPGGTPEFNAELAKVHLLALPIVAGPCMVMMMIALWRFIAGLKEITGLTTDQILRAEPEKK